MAMQHSGIVGIRHVLVGLKEQRLSCEDVSIYHNGTIYQVNGGGYPDTLFMRDLPPALMVDDELEDTMSIGCSERDRILPWLSRDRWKGRTDMGIQHSEFKLKITNPRVRLPRGDLGVVSRYFSAEYLNQQTFSRPFSIPTKVGKAHNAIVGSISFTGCSLVHSMMRDTVDS